MSEVRPSRWRWLHRGEDLVLATALGLLVVLAISQIALRTLFDSGTLWLEPLLRSLVLWVAMLGGMVAAREGRHIGLDIAGHALPPMVWRAGRLLAFAFAAAVCAVLAWHSGRMVADEYAIGTLAFAAVPAWAVQAILPIAFALMAVRLLITALRAPPPLVPAEVMEPTPP